MARTGRRRGRSSPDVERVEPGGPTQQGGGARQELGVAGLRWKRQPEAPNKTGRAPAGAQRTDRDLSSYQGVGSGAVPQNGDSHSEYDPWYANRAVNNKSRDPRETNSCVVSRQACRGEAGGNLRNKSLACDHILNIRNSHASLRWIRSATHFGIGNPVPQRIPTDLVGY